MSLKVTIICRVKSCSILLYSCMLYYLSDPTGFSDIRIPLHSSINRHNPMRHWYESYPDWSLEFSLINLFWLNIWSRLNLICNANGIWKGNYLFYKVPMVVVNLTLSFMLWLNIYSRIFHVKIWYYLFSLFLNQWPTYASTGGVSFI